MTILIDDNAQTKGSVPDKEHNFVLVLNQKQKNELLSVSLLTFSEF